MFFYYHRILTKILNKIKKYLYKITKVYKINSVREMYFNKNFNLPLEFAPHQNDQ